MPPVSGSALSAPGAERIFHETMLALRDADPYPGYRRLREKAPVLLTREGVLVLTRHADCAAALRHPLLGARGGAPGLGATGLPEDELVLALRTVQDGMAFADPSGHARLRRLVSSAFAGRHVEGLRRAVTARVDARLRALAKTPGADFVTGLALPLPVDVLADLLGFAEADRAALLPLVGEMNAAFRSDAGRPARSRAAHAQAALADLLGGLLSARRSRPRDDLLSRLAASRADDALTADEAVGAALLLLGAGGETTGHLLGNALHALLAEPGQFELLCRDPSLIPGAVEELLRYDAPVQAAARSVLEPFAFLGVQLEPGRTVLALLGAAGRDPGLYEEPDRLDVARAPRPAPAHLAFAAGPHCCLGAHLARLALEVLLQRLVADHPRCALAGPPVRDGGLALRGFARLPVVLAP
ncbi:cytochrome P450 [Actinocorallia populi]|uniref:cytochrome P450 n=1 Tax=Actinocorallia populi TaxID=2079200 RepID=UPI000D09003E|nr:cytochrome P450 [Actinocorallia populi]